MKGNCVRDICTECLVLQKNWISRASKIRRKILYIIYVRKVWICRKIEYPELRKFNGKFCALCMYRMFGFAEKLNIQNCKILMGNYICTNGLDLLKNWISRTAKLCTLYLYVMSGFAKNLNVQNSANEREIVYIICTECPELRKFDGKLCTFYTFGMSGFAEKLNIQNCENWTENCVHYMHGMSGLAEKLNIPYRLYSTGNCVHYICTENLDLQKNWISKTAKIHWEIVYIIYVRNVWIC